MKLILIRFIEKMMTLTVLFHDNNNDMKAIIITMYDNMMIMKLIESDDNDGWIGVIMMFCILQGNDDNDVIIKSDVVYFLGQAPS